MVNNNLSEVRKAKGLTQEGLAEKSGVSRVTIGNIERGAVTNLKTSTMLSLSNALGTTVEEIFCLDSQAYLIKMKGGSYVGEHLAGRQAHRI